MSEERSPAPGAVRRTEPSLAVELVGRHAARARIDALLADAQWLDTSSTEALLFAARRLDAEGVALLFAAGETEAETLDRAHLEELTLGGLAEEEGAALLARRLERDLSPALAAHLVRATG